MTRNEDIYISLYEIDALKFEDHKLKSSDISPLYIDLRATLEHPSILLDLCRILSTDIYKLKLDFDYIIGLPYMGIPIATHISSMLHKPMLLMRKEQKSYGTKKLIEGSWKPNQKVILIDDLISNGSSKVEAIDIIQSQGLIVSHIATVIDRRKKANMPKYINNIPISSCFDIYDLLISLKMNDIISNDLFYKINNYFDPNY